MNRTLPPPRTKEQVARFLEKCAKNNSDQSAANLMLSHGNLTDDARAYVENWVSRYE